MSIEDKAQEHEAIEWAARNAPRPQKPTYHPEQPGYGPEACDECGDPMPAFRRSNGWVLCTACQTKVESVRFRR